MVKELDRTFKVTHTDSAGEEHELVCKINKPTVEQLATAKSIYNRSWKTAVRDGAVLAVKLQDFIKEHELWNEERENRVQELRKNIHDADVKLAKGGFSLEQARKLAIDMRKWRFELRELMTIETELENKTAEAQAEEDRHNYLLVACTVYSDSEEPVWKDVSEYLNPSIPELAIAASIKYATLRYGIEDNFEEKLPENVFLKKYGFVNEDLRLVNKDGKFVDIEGNLIDEDGNPLDENGDKEDSVEDTLPFLDENGQPVEIPE